MKNNILKTITISTLLTGIVSIQAFAEWRQPQNGIWEYYNSENKKVTDAYVDGIYYVDSNGIWMDNIASNKQFYFTIFFNKENGQIRASKENVGTSWMTSVTREDGRVREAPLIVKYSDFEEGLSVFSDYHVINDNGIWKVDKINK